MRTLTMMLLFICFLAVTTTCTQTYANTPPNADVLLDTSASTTTDTSPNTHAHSTTNATANTSTTSGANLNAKAGRAIDPYADIGANGIATATSHTRTSTHASTNATAIPTRMRARTRVANIDTNANADANSNGHSIACTPILKHNLMLRPMITSIRGLTLFPTRIRVSIWVLLTVPCIVTGLVNTMPINMFMLLRQNVLLRYITVRGSKPGDSVNALDSKPERQSRTNHTAGGGRRSAEPSQVKSKLRDCAPFKAGECSEISGSECFSPRKNDTKHPVGFGTAVPRSRRGLRVGVRLAGARRPRPAGWHDENLPRFSCSARTCANRAIWRGVVACSAYHATRARSHNEGVRH